MAQVARLSNDMTYLNSMGCAAPRCTDDSQEKIDPKTKDDKCLTSRSIKNLVKIMGAELCCTFQPKDFDWESYALSQSRCTFGHVLYTS